MDNKKYIEDTLKSIRVCYDKYAYNHMNNAKYNNISRLKELLTKAERYTKFYPDDREWVLNEIEKIMGLHLDEMEEFIKEETELK